MQHPPVRVAFAGSQFGVLTPGTRGGGKGRNADRVGAKFRALRGDFFFHPAEKARFSSRFSRAYIISIRSTQGWRGVRGFSIYRAVFALLFFSFIRRRYATLSDSNNYGTVMLHDKIYTTKRHLQRN